METKVKRVMYMKFNKRDNHASLMDASTRGLIVTDLSFKDVLDDEINKTNVDIDTCINKETPYAEVALLWQAQIHQNYIKTRRKLGW